jgi:hypothetical protein
MIKNLLFLLFVATLFALSSCKGGADSSASSDSSQIVNAGNEERLVLPAMPNDVKMMMLKKCLNIDYIMHDLPISVSQTEEQAVMANILFADDAAPEYIPKECKPIGRKFYGMKDGSSIEADIYFTQGCTFYVFLRDNEKIYANKLNDRGIAFYNQIIQAAIQGMQGQ